ncbi:phosphate:Na+ symporter [Mesorhizobium sp. J18]|uniref:Na/Pi cotransporter family protein n=1 Tax=Mesorhizobium sp. J18 TaxID=935263 RepID=UPI001199215A|nr:Na/Pi cotransporter family protein [Mesorhizobium sp. J18]TWG92759.1 phosphate:Na+ symporter [Mesorhizobium sp. J18]
MSGSVVLLHLAGAVALLLWATRMVRTGVERAYGDVLKRRLRATMNNALLATSFGLALAVAFQSSTAVTLLVGSFAGSGIVTGLAGIMAVRRAELGSALVVKILSFDLSLLVPVCLVAGTAIFMTTERRDWRQVGRITIGVGLMILSLQLMEEATEPLRHSEILPVIVRYLSGDPVTAYLLAALVTWLFHSSIAAVLLLAALGQQGIVHAELAVVMVLGINLGSSVIAPLLTRGAAPAARVVPLGNLLMRGLGSLLMLAAFLAFDPPVGFLGSDAERQIVHAHILFNVIILVAGIPLSGLTLRATKAIVARMSPQDTAKDIAGVEVSALDPEALKTPHLALSNATREVVRVCETIELMLVKIIDLYEDADKERIEALAALDDRVDRRHAAIKLYLARIAKSDMSEADTLRCQELLDACIKLEQVGDIIVRNMLVHVKRKMQRRVAFTPEGWRELAAFHASVLANARLAFNVLISRDRETALQLVKEKDRLRDREKETSGRHFSRLREGETQSVETSTIHLDTIRDLKQINSLLASIAYPVLEEHGLLRHTRLNPAG